MLIVNYYNGSHSDKWGKLIISISSVSALEEKATCGMSSQAVKFVVRINGPKMQTIIVTFMYQSETTELTIGIPAGRNRHIIISTYDTVGRHINTDGVEIDIEAGSTVQMRVQNRSTNRIISIIK